MTPRSLPTLALQFRESRSGVVSVEWSVVEDALALKNAVVATTVGQGASLTFARAELTLAWGTWRHRLGVVEVEERLVHLDNPPD